MSETLSNVDSIWQWVNAPHDLFPLVTRKNSDCQPIYDFLLSICNVDILEEEFIDEQIEGLCDVESLIIYINKLLPVKSKVLVLLHELGHLMMHQIHRMNEPIREFQAELFTWVVAESFGISQPFFHAHYCLNYFSKMKVTTQEYQSIIEHVLRNVNQFNQMIKNFQTLSAA